MSNITKSNIEDEYIAEIKTLKRALELACEKITELYSSCPYHYYYHTESPLECTTSSDECDTKKTDEICWQDHFIKQSREEG